MEAKPITAGELLDALTEDLSSGKISRDQPLIIYSATGRAAICKTTTINISTTPFTGAASLMLAYSK